MRKAIVCRQHFSQSCLSLDHCNVLFCQDNLMTLPEKGQYGKISDKTWWNGVVFKAFHGDGIPVLRIRESQGGRLFLREQQNPLFDYDDACNGKADEQVKFKLKTKNGDFPPILWHLISGTWNRWCLVNGFVLDFNVGPMVDNHRKPSLPMVARPQTPSFGKNDHHWSLV